MLHRSLLSLAAIAAAAAALFGATLLSPQPASADGHGTCIDRAPGDYVIDVPAVAAINQPAAALPTTVGDGGEIISLIEPGGLDLVAVGALEGLIPFYTDVMTIDGEKVNVVDCPWMGGDAMDDDAMDDGAMDDDSMSGDAMDDDSMSMPATGTGGLLSAASGIGSALPMIAIGASAVISALAVALGIRRKR